MKNHVLRYALFASMMLAPVLAFAQEESDIIEPTDAGYSTLFSVKLSGGYGLGRGRQLYGFNNNDQVFWSLGEGTKMDIAFDVPLLPVEIINPDGTEAGPERFPYVGLELEAATGYHISNGGTTSDALNGFSAKTTRSYTYIPVTLGFNARATLGPGLPSIYLGAGGGIYLKGIYEEHMLLANSPTTVTRTYDPPLPFALYGLLGVEFPLMYSPDDGNSLVDLFLQLKLSEVTNYVYKYTQTTSDGESTVVNVTGDPARSASNVALNLGIKINLF
jgi:PKD repeat protein